MKLIKLITACFVMAVGLLVPANAVFADRCGRSDDNANTTHPDNDQNGDHNCPVDSTLPETTVPPVPPTPLPETGAGTTIAVIGGVLIIAGGALLYVRKKR